MYTPTNRIKEILEECDIKLIWVVEKHGKSFYIVNSYVCNCRQTSLGAQFDIAKVLKISTKELIADK